MASTRSQHRGQESAGIAASNGENILVFKDMGLVSQVFDEGALEALQGHIAVGHTRYSTTGASTWANAQPTLGPTAHGTVALGHNGNLTNTERLLELLEERVGSAKRDHDAGRQRARTPRSSRRCSAGTSSTPSKRPRSNCCRTCAARSPLCSWTSRTCTRRATRTACGRLCLGQLPSGGWVVASEIPALDIVGAAFVREVEPGEFLLIDDEGVHSQRFAEADPKGCIFEYVYLARPDTSIAGRSMQAARLEMGRTLAREHPVEADLVIPVPECGTPAAVGYAQASGIPFAQGLTKNAYVGRTFIQPSQTLRQLGIRLKLNPLREVIAGKRLIVVDDTIVRGNTQRAIIAMLREAGAAEVHVRISAPPVHWPCFYGIDFPTRDELAAVGNTLEELRIDIGADSLGHISLEGMIAATQQAEPRLCTACFTGQYPIEPPVDARHLLMSADRSEVAP